MKYLLPAAIIFNAMASLSPGFVSSAAAQAAASTPEATKTERSAPSVTVTEIIRTPIVDTIITTGTLVAREEILIANQVEGYAISEILVEEGDRVIKGQVLARLSREILDATLAQNTAQIAKADASIAAAKSAITDADAARVQAQASFQRTRTLRTEGFASAETFDQRQASAQQTSAKLASAREQLRVAEADKLLSQAMRNEIEIKLSRTEIKAPADGIISRRTARIGAIASAAATEPLFRLIRDGAIELEADVAETTLNRLAVNQVAAVTPAGRDTALPAKVRLISAEIGKASRLGRVRLALENSQGLTIGSFARGVIEIVRKEALVTPLSAVLFANEGARVQVVKNGVVETRVITTGVRTGNTVEVLSGLEAGEVVVTISGTFLRNGDRVTPILAK
jgi:HlyD family secretion protein